MRAGIMGSSSFMIFSLWMASDSQSEHVDVTLFDGSAKILLHWVQLFVLWLSEINVIEIIKDLAKHCFYSVTKSSLSFFSSNLKKLKLY